MNPFENFDNNNGNGPGMLLPPNYAIVKNPDTGAIRIGKVGFSFTSLFFSFWPSVFRGDFYNTFCMIGVEIGTAMALTVIMGINLTQSLYNSYMFFPIVWAFIYNLMYFRHLQNKGFKPIDKRSADLLFQSKYFKKD